MFRRYIGAALIQFELLRSGSNRRVHMARWGLLYLAGGGLWMVWTLAADQVRGGVMEDIPVLYAVGSWILLFLLLLANMCVISMSFSEERNLSTFPVLLSTPLTSFGICFAKWASVMIRSVLILLVMMPFVSLLFVEGGLATEQIFATNFLIVCMLAFYTAVGVFASVTTRKAGLGISQSICLFVLSVIAYVFLIEFLPVWMERHGNNAALANLLTVGCRNHIVSWRAFAFVSVGDPSVMGLMLYSILLVQGVLHVAATLFVLWVSSILLRVMEHSGADSIWAALRRKKSTGKTKDPGARKAWERGPCEPWLSSPYVWRSIAPRASFLRRARRGMLEGFLTLSIVFLPIVLLVGISVVMYLVGAVRIFLTEGVWPLLPRAFPWTVGSMPRYVPDTGRLAYESKIPGGGWHFYISAPNWIDNGVQWAALLSCIVIALLLFVLPILMAITVPRDRGSKQLSLLLSTSMSDKALYKGFWYSVIARARGPLAALLLTALILPWHEDVHVVVVVGMLFVFVSAITFWGSLAMYFGLSSATARSALLKFGGTVFLSMVVLPGIATFLIALLDHLMHYRSTESLLAIVTMPNPFFQLGAFGIVLTEYFNGGPCAWEPVIAAGVYAILFHGAGMGIQLYCKRNVRKLLRRHG